MKVLFLSPTAILGGAERCLLDMIASLRAAEEHVRLAVLLGQSGPLVEEVRCLGATPIVVPLPAELAEVGESFRPAQGLSHLAAAAAAARYAMNLRQAIRDVEPDVVHSNGIKMHLLGALVRPERSALVLHLHDFSSSRRFAAPALRVAARRAHLAIAISDAVASDARRLFPALRVERIYNGIDTAEFNPAGERADLGGPGAALHVGMVGTYARWKGQRLFLEAVKRIVAVEDRPNVHFHVIGGPVYATRGSQFTLGELEGYARELGISKRVTFTPFHQHPAAVFRALNVVAHTSTRPEPFGRTIIEAMACERPVVISGDGGARELVRDGEDGLVVPPRNRDALAAALLTLVRDEVMRKRLGNEGRRSVVARFNRDRLGPELLSAYRQARGA